jgi:branched-chain amino acid transport system substrate-binding protein
MGFPKQLLNCMTPRRLWCVVFLLAVSACNPPPAPPSTPKRQPMAYTQPSHYVPAPSAVPTPPELPAKIVKVGLLVPLTGRDAALGRAMIDATTLALYDKYAALSPVLAATRVVIVPKDTGDMPESAAQAARDAIKEGAVILLGPIFSDAVAAVAPVAQEANIQAISFSNTKSVAAPGVYLFGFSPEQQTARVVTYAIERKHKVAALLANTSFGNTVLEAAKKAAAASGATIEPVSRYLPLARGATQAVDALKQDAHPFTALLMPESSATLDTLISTLLGNGFTAANTQLLGTGVWDDPDVISKHSLEGALLASSSPVTTQAYLNRFRTSYGYVPPRLSSLAYDATALTITLATTGRPFTAETLTAPGGFTAPANGAFRFFKDGTSERALCVLKVHGSGYEIVSNAPNLFK